MIKVKIFEDEYLLGDPDTFTSADDRLNTFLENNNVEFIDVRCATLGSSRIVLLLVYKEKGE